MKNKRIQCRECTSFRHIRAEWANILKTKNNSFNASRSDGDSEYSKDDESNFIVFASRIDNTRVAEIKSSSSIPTSVPRDVPTGTYESGDDEDLTEEKLL